MTRHLHYLCGLQVFEAKGDTPQAGLIHVDGSLNEVILQLQVRPSLAYNAGHTTANDS